MIAWSPASASRYFWLRNRSAADAIWPIVRAIHRLLLDKYYVDEIYDAAIVQPIKTLSTGGLWKGVDAGLIDGTVNGVGLVVSGASSGAAADADRFGPDLRVRAVRRGRSSVILAYYLFR